MTVALGIGNCGTAKLLFGGLLHIHCKQAIAVNSICPKAESPMANDLLPKQRLLNYRYHD